MEDDLQFRISLSPLEDPDLVAMLGPMNGRARGQSVRRLLRRGLSMESGGSYVPVVRTEPGFDISELQSPSEFSFESTQTT